MPEQQQRRKRPSIRTGDRPPDPLPRTCIPQGPRAVPSPFPWGSRAPGLGVTRYLPPGQSPDSRRRQGQGPARVGGVRPRCQPEPQAAAEPPFVSAESRSHGASGAGCSGRGAGLDAPPSAPPRSAAGLRALSPATRWASRAVPCRHRTPTDFRPLQRPR